MTQIQLKTYGKMNPILKYRIQLKERFKINKHSENLLKQKGLSAYIPKLNKLRLVVGGLLVVGCLMTPATNWLIPFLVGWGLK